MASNHRNTNNLWTISSYSIAVFYCILHHLASKLLRGIFLKPRCLPWCKNCATLHTRLVWTSHQECGSSQNTACLRPPRFVESTRSAWSIVCNASITASKDFCVQSFPPERTWQTTAQKQHADACWTLLPLSRDQKLVNAAKFHKISA